MNDDYKIIDTRTDFSKSTFSGYKKRDVYNVLYKSMDTKKVENSCHWITECICSSYIEESWNNLLLYGFKTVNINNPTLPNFLYKQNMIFYNIYDSMEKNGVYNLKNNQIIRNLFFSIVTILTLSSKTKRYDKYPRFKPMDFDFDTIQKRLTANVNLLPSDFIRFEEPEELKIIMNEIYFHLKNKIGGYEKSLYWILWILEWEKRNIKANNSWKIDCRDVDVKAKFTADLIWIVWNVILLEANNRNMFIKRQIKSLYELYKFQFNLRKRNKRLPYIIQCVCYLTHTINETIPLISDKLIYIQTGINNNTMFQSKKINEKNDIIKDKLKPSEKKPQSQKIVEKKMEKEKTKSKLDIFNELDKINI